MIELVTDNIGAIFGGASTVVAVALKTRAVKFVKEVREATTACKSVYVEYQLALQDGKLDEAEIRVIGNKLATAIDELTDVASVGAGLWSWWKRR